MAEKNVKKMETAGTKGNGDKAGALNTGAQKDNIMSFQYSATTVDLETVDIQADALGLIPERIALEHEVLPMRLEDGVLTVITNNPDDLQLIDTLSILTNMRIKTVSPIAGDLQSFIKSKYSGAQIVESGSMLSLIHI